MKQVFDDCKCVFDITYGDGFSDIYGKVWNANTDLAKQIAIMSKAPLVLMPQTYGPFYTNVLKKWAIHLVKKSICTRNARIRSRKCCGGNRFGFCTAIL